MTHVNHNPANDFPIGSPGMVHLEETDTEGHINKQGLDEVHLEEAEVHLEEADTEGHVAPRSLDEVHLEEADTEGHIAKK